MLKKRIFQEGLTILPESRDSERDSISDDGQVQTENIPKGQTKKQRLEAKRDEKRNIKEKKTAMDERFTEQGDSMLCAVKELVQIMKEDSQAVDVDRDLSSGQYGRIEKLEAEQRNLAVEVQEIKKVAQSTAENVAMVLQLLQQGGSMGVGSASGELPKE